MLLSAEEARSRLAASNVLGGTFTPHCAAIHPSRLVRGLARTVVGLGVALYEQTVVTAVRRGQAKTAGGRVNADVVIRATEGYTPGLPGYRRAIAPVYAPRSRPKSSLSMRVAGMAPQFTCTIGRLPRGLRAWMACAKSCFPTPVSPSSKTVAGVDASPACTAAGAAKRG